MDKKLFDSLWGILTRLAHDCQQAIQPDQCILEETRKGTGYHFRIPLRAPRRSRKQVIAWAHLRPGGSMKLGVRKSCVTVSVYAGSLNIKAPTYSSYFHPDANYEKGGPGEVQAAISEVDDNNYRLILKAIVEAAKAL